MLFVIQVVEMLISAMRMNDSIEMSVVNNHLYSSTMDSIKGKITPNLSNMNNNNNNTAKHMTELLETSFFKENIKSNSLDIEQQSTTKIDESHLRPPLKHLNHLSDRDFSRSVPALSTGKNRQYQSPCFFVIVLLRNYGFSKRFSINENNANIE